MSTSLSFDGSKSDTDCDSNRLSASDSNRDRLLALLSGSQPDRLPWFADLDYWASSKERTGEFPAGYRTTQAYFDLHRDLGAGFYLQGYWPFKTVYTDDIRVDRIQDGDIRRTKIDTPAGTVTEEWRFLRTSFSEAPVKRFVETPADLAVIASLFEAASYQPDYAELERRVPMIGDNGVLLAYLPRSPFMQMVTELSSLEALVRLWVDARHDLERTLSIIASKHDEAARIAVESPAGCLMIPENLSSELIGKRFFESYLRPYETRWVDRIRAAGKHSFIHMDGTLKGLIAEVASVGFDVIEAVTPKPVGDLDFAEMRALTGPTTILWGGIPGVYFTPLVSDQEFDRFVAEVAQTMKQSPRYVLGVADQVPPDGLRSRIARVAEIVTEMGVY